MQPTDSVQRSSTLPPSGDPRPSRGGPPPAAPTPGAPRKRLSLIHI
ncbi:hypothetical protein [Burkholderia vietnamiensis]|nr:hypothetical protein [Burkholderia vietnamiensis]